MYGSAAYAQIAFDEESAIGSLTLDIQRLATEALIELFVLDATSLGGTITRFHADTNQLKVSVVWQGNTYSPFPVQADGFEYTGRGKLPRPTMRINNTDGLVGALVDTYDDLIGAVVTRKRTFVKYLDAVNFPGGLNASADPSAAFPDDVYSINRKAAHTKSVIEFELASSFDVQGVLLPRRQMTQNVCMWTYRSTECSYTGVPVATVDNIATTSSSLDACGKRLTSCILRFGANGVLPFGGFPGIGVVTE